MVIGIPLVLCAEDEESDAIILQRAFSKAHLSNPLVIVKDGQAVVDYLSGSAPYNNRSEHPLPALVLLDLKMPRKTGFDVLGWIGTRSELQGIPVVVLSSSSSDADIRKARAMGARDYLVKPNDLGQYVKIVQGLHARWLTSVSSQL
jgi:CheY-like chemotaxis protein